MSYVLMQTAALITVLVAAAGSLSGSSAAASARPELPDLVIAPSNQILIGTEFNGRKWLEFTTSIANVGRGPIEVDASRPATSAPWKAVQRIRRSDGSWSVIPRPRVKFTYAGATEHGHWHIRGAARYELWRLGKIAKIRVKRGFCLYDSTRYRGTVPGAAKRSIYGRAGCGDQQSLRLDTGVSVGWQDDYFFPIPGQRMDMTNLPNGRYRLVNRVDPRNVFRESDETNNTTWVDLVVGDKTVKVVGRSPRPTP